MTAWLQIREDFIRLVRLYVLVTLALLALIYFDFGLELGKVPDFLLPNFVLLGRIVTDVWNVGFFAVIHYFSNVRIWLFMAQVGIAAVLVFWLLSTLLPAFVASAHQRFASFKGEALPSQNPTAQKSPWSVVLTMTICLVFSFHVIGALIARYAMPRGDAAAQYFVGGYPDLAALVLSFIGILGGFIKSRGATTDMHRVLGATRLPDDDPLTLRVHAFAAQLNLPPPSVWLMDKLNAYAMGSKPSDTAVVIGRPLVEMLSPEELDGIIGHELGHLASRDLRRIHFAVSYQQIVGGLFGATFGMLALAARNGRSRDRLAETLHTAGRSTVAFASELLLKRLSRVREYDADRTGAMLTSPEVMTRGLDKILNANRRVSAEESRYGYFMLRSAMRGNIFSTHPTFEQRRESLLNFAEETEGKTPPALATANLSAFPPAQATSFKVMAAVTLVALIISATWAQTASRDRLQANEDRKRADASLSSANSRNASAEADLANKRRQFEADQENWKTRQNVAQRDEERAALRKKEAEAAIARLEELRRAPMPPRSAQIATADSAAPPSPPPIAAPLPAPTPLPAAPVSTPTVQYDSRTVMIPSGTTLTPQLPPRPRPALTVCDQLAANPTDPQRNGAGVSFPILRKNPGPAIAACEESRAATPWVSSQKYQLARALYAANSKDSRAETLFGELVDQSYPAAYDNLGQIYRNRNDVQRAAQVYRKGAQAGDPDSMISLADLIREQKLPPMVANEDDRLYDLAASLGHANAKKDVEERRLKGLVIQTGVIALRSMLGLQ